MLKFNSIVREATPQSTINGITYYATPRAEYKDVWVNSNKILHYRKVEKDNDECLKIYFEKGSFSSIGFSDNFLVCKKDEETAYNTLITQPKKRTFIVEKDSGDINVKET